MPIPSISLGEVDIPKSLKELIKAALFSEMQSQGKYLNPIRIGYQNFKGGLRLLAVLRSDSDDLVNTTGRALALVLQEKFNSALTTNNNTKTQLTNIQHYLLNSDEFL